jgi:hypothetical protein
VELTANPATVAEGALLTLTVQVSAPDGAPFTLSWNGLPNTCGGAASSSMSSTTSSFSCNPTQLGPFSPNVQVTNSTGITEGGSTTLTVYAPLSVTLSASPSSVTVGRQITFDYQVSGGVSPYGLSWTNLPGGCPGPNSVPNTNPASFGCSPTQSSGSNGNEVTLQVTDSAAPANVQSASTQVTVYAALQVSFSVSPGSVTAGSQVTFNYQVTGGQSPYQLQWNGLPSSCVGPAPSSVSDNNPHSFQCSPSQSGNTQVGLQVTDSASPSNSVSAPSQSLSVTSSGNNNNGNGNNNNGNSNGGNGNNSSSLSSLFSSIGSLFLIAAILAITAFALLVIIAVSTLVTAVVVARRLPKRSQGRVETVPCPSCGAAAPATSKFCPECGKPIALGKPA